MLLRCSVGQNTGVERLEPDVGMAGAQGAMRPFALKLAKQGLPFRDGQTSPLDLGHNQSLGRDAMPEDLMPVKHYARKA